MHDITEPAPSTDGHVAGHPLAAEVERLRARLSTAQEKIVNLQIALDTGRTIGAAIGIVMSQRRIGRDEAFDLLRAASQRRHMKIRLLAEEVLYTGVLDEDAPADGTSSPPQLSRGALRTDDAES